MATEGKGLREDGVVKLGKQRATLTPVKLRNIEVSLQLIS